MRPIMGKAVAQIESGDGYLDFGFVPDYVKLYQQLDSSGNFNAASDEAMIEGQPDSISGSGNGLLIALKAASSASSVNAVSGQKLMTSGVKAHSKTRLQADADSLSTDTAFAGIKLVGSSMSASLNSVAGYVGFGFRED